MLRAHTVNLLHFVFALRAHQFIFTFFSRAPLRVHCFLGELEDIFLRRIYKVPGPAFEFCQGPSRVK